MSRPTSARAVSTRAATISVVRLPLGEADVRPTFRRERAAMKRGVWPIAGCDEAGRGPRAGPSIAAKVPGARLMTALGMLYPVYVFDHHKGYSVPEPFEAPARLGPPVPHRRSFAPVAAAYGDVVTGSMETGEIEPGVLPL